MTTSEDLVYRQVVTLRDGARVLLSPLTRDDRQALYNLLLPVSIEESGYMRHDVRDPAVLDQWIDHLDYTRVLPITCSIGDRIVGLASLHFNTGPARLRAEVRIFLAKDYRQRGLGTRLLQALIDLAQKRNLHLLEVQIIRNLISDIKAFESVGFKIQAVIEDYFMMPDGELRDIALLTYQVKKPEAEF